MFKLVRIDDDYHREIELKDGKQEIGRDQMLDCDDKRVSRRHAEFEITDDSVYIKSLHLNPCFFVKNNMVDAQILKQNRTVRGYHGDKIGFLPDKQWYQIFNAASFVAGPVGLVGDSAALKSIIQKMLLDDKEESVKEEESKEEYEKSVKAEESEGDRETPDKCTDEPAQVLGESDLNSKSNSEDSTQCYQPKTEEQSPAKRCLIKEEPASPAEVKRVKIEQQQDDENAPSNEDVAGPSNNSSGNGEPSDQQRLKRERCMYGKDCYRKNQQHKVQFSHPGDADWGEGAQGECPYGYACARRDPRHWRDHTHPYGMQPPPPPGMRKKRTHIVQRHGNIYYINAEVVNFYDDHFVAEDSDGESVDYDYEFD